MMDEYDVYVFISLKLMDRPISCEKSVIFCVSEVMISHAIELLIASNLFD